MTFLRAVSDEKGTTDAKAMINPTNTTATASAAVRHGCFRDRASLDGISIIGHFQVSREPDPSARSSRAAGGGLRCESPSGQLNS